MLFAYNNITADIWANNGAKCSLRRAKCRFFTHKHTYNPKLSKNWNFRVEAEHSILVPVVQNIRAVTLAQ